MTPPARTFGARFTGALFLNVDVFEEVEHDESATGQAAAVVALGALAASIGGVGAGAGSMIANGIAVLVGWMIWSGIVYLVGHYLFGGRATWGEVLRAFGFAQAPSVFYVFGVIPILSWPLLALVNLWVMVAGFIGIRQALDIGNAKTFFTILVAGLVNIVLHAIF